eukprot:SAG31_NODE_1369_length_8611_cov_3.505169_5_plen_197_part_00
MCDECPEHSGTAAAGATHADACECNPGYYRDEDTDVCTACPIGAYKSVQGPDPCTPCNDGHVTDDTGSSDVAQCHAPKTSCVEPKDMLGYTCEDYVIGGRECSTMLSLKYDCKCTCGDPSKLPSGCSHAVSDLTKSCSNSVDILNSNICDSACTKNVLHYANACKDAQLPVLTKLLGSAPSLQKLCGNGDSTTLLY